MIISITWRTWKKQNGFRLYLPGSQGPGPELVDGLVVQNPKSFLLKEWARRDVFNSPLGRGFSFLLTNLGHRRFIIGVDPEAGVNLRGLGSLLNQREKEKRERLGRPVSERWYEGNCPFFDYRIIDSPRTARPSTTGKYWKQSWNSVAG